MKKNTDKQQPRRANDLLREVLQSLDSSYTKDREPDDLSAVINTIPSLDEENSFPDKYMTKSKFLELCPSADEDTYQWFIHAKERDQKEMTCQK